MATLSRYQSDGLPTFDEDSFSQHVPFVYPEDLQVESGKCFQVFSSVVL